MKDTLNEREKTRVNITFLISSLAPLYVIRDSNIFEEFSNTVLTTSHTSCSSAVGLASK